jgi:hypothetical protein
MKRPTCPVVAKILLVGFLLPEDLRSKHRSPGLDWVFTGVSGLEILD